MALKKSKTLSNGISGEYWKIVSESFDRLTRSITWEIALFKEQSYSKERHLGFVKRFSFELTLEEEVSNRTALGYVKIKEKANQQVTRDLLGRMLPKPVAFDADLADAEDV